MEISAREAALKALESCRREGAWSGASIDRVIKKYDLQGREAALASRLCLGVLQNSAFCDYYVGLYSKVRLEPKLRDLLRLGVYQLLFLDKIPPRAAVNETVALCKKTGLSRAAGLANAVLRRIAAEKDSLPPIPGEGSAEYLSLRYSHPAWLTERLIAERGYAFTEGFLAANNSPPELCIQINRLRISPEDYLRALARLDIDYRADEDLPGCVHIARAPVVSLPGYEEGLFYVQDKAARAAVEIAGPRPGDRVLDACAAPGGKSFAAAMLMEGRGGITSRDIHGKKLALIESGARRLGIDIISTAAADARDEDRALYAAFDLVIADVPCSGFGVIRKRPEIRFRSERDTAALPDIQAAITASLARCVKPGGTLLYSTCTVLRDENEAQVTRFLAENPNFEPVDFVLGNIRSQNGAYTFWPNTDGTDGFFAAKMRRKY